MRKAQLDERSFAAAEFARLVTQADVSQSGLGGEDKRRAEAALDALRGWDGSLPADSTRLGLGSGLGLAANPNPNANPYPSPNPDQRRRVPMHALRARAG